MVKRGRKPIYNLSQLTCPNSYCQHFQKTGLSNIVSNGNYSTRSGKGRRFRCKTCGGSFCLRSGTIFKGLRAREEKVISALKLLSKGMSIRKTASIMRIKPDTLRNWLTLMAARSDSVNNLLIVQAGISPEDLESLWNCVRNGALRQRAILWRKKCGWWQGWKDT